MQHPENKTRISKSSPVRIDCQDIIKVVNRENLPLKVNFRLAWEREYQNSHGFMVVVFFFCKHAQLSTPHVKIIRCHVKIAKRIKILVLSKL